MYSSKLKTFASDKSRGALINRYKGSGLPLSPISSGDLLANLGSNQ